MILNTVNTLKTLPANISKDIYSAQRLAWKVRVCESHSNDISIYIGKYIKYINVSIIVYNYI